ncbi:P-II family nitrogen regulator [Maricaulaceae bacterium MS644]
MTLFHKATKIVLVVEKLLRDKVIAIVEAEGAKGYTVVEGAGKGAHGLHGSDRPGVAQGFTIVRIEVIVADRAAAERIAETVASRYFKEYSGIVYMDDVDVLRRDKF